MENVLTETECRKAAEQIERVADVLDTILFGQEELVRLLLGGVLARGHVLLEGLPGLGKTELVKGLAKLLQLQVKRVQFTPDLLPGDITGNPILQESPTGRKFVFQPGPVFTNLLLADEINRASPKTQSALLEAMQERTVTVLGEVHQLPEPFFVLATQNPIELEGTYPLPEAQLDRFLFRLEVHRNSPDVIERIVKERELGVELDVQPILTRDELLQLIAYTRRVFLPDVVANYIARLVDGTHPGVTKASRAVKFGVSPRAALALAAAARAQALIAGRLNTSFEDVAAVVYPVFGHRIILDYASRLQGVTTRDVVEQLLVEVSRVGGALPQTLEDVTLQ